MSFKRIKALKSEKHISSPSLDFYATSSNSLKDLNYVGNINEKITNLQKNLEETQINFLGEKQQKLEKLSEIQTLFEKNKRINKNLIQATLK